MRKLHRGEPVLVQDLRARKTQWVRGQCRDQLTDRSYMYIVDVDGQLLHHNRQFLKPSQGLPPTDSRRWKSGSVSCSGAREFSPKVNDCRYPLLLGPGGLLG